MKLKYSQGENHAMQKTNQTLSYHKTANNQDTLLLSQETIKPHKPAIGKIIGSMLLMA